MKKNPLISIVIPTRNSQKFLEKCLTYLAKQTYQNIEIIVVDGLSSDNTINIANKFNCKILMNKELLAEPGVSLGILKAKGDFCIVIAVDNFFIDKNAIKKMVDMATENNLSIVFPKHCSEESYNLITKYINNFSDPFTHFIKGYSTNGRTFAKKYDLVKKTQHGEVYNFSNTAELPTIALAQGIMVSKVSLADRNNDYDDMLPVIDMIRSGQKVGFANQVCLYHDTISDLGHFFRKQRWAARNAFLKKKFGIASRINTLTKQERLLSVIFPFYGVLFLPALCKSLIAVIYKQESKLWLMHAPLAFVSAVAIWYEFFYSLFDKSKNNVSRM